MMTFFRCVKILVDMSVEKYRSIPVTPAMKAVLSI